MSARSTGIMCDDKHIEAYGLFARRTSPSRTSIDALSTSMTSLCKDCNRECRPATAKVMIDRTVLRSTRHNVHINNRLFQIQHIAYPDPIHSLALAAASSRNALV